MNKLKAGSLITGWIALVTLTTPASAGTLTVTSGPIFTPDTAFTNNTITVVVLHNPPGVTGDLVKVSGGATITPPASNSATVDIAGNYSANAGDLASVAYSFTVDANVSVPVNYTASGSATILGVPQNFSTMGTIMPGLHQYTGTFQAPSAFPIPASGTFSASLSLDFGSTFNATGLAALPGTLDLRIEQIGFQLATTAATNPPRSQALNISTRLGVDLGENVLIAGFINSGPDDKRVLIRGIGPSLSAFFSGVLPDPILRLHAGAAKLYHNDNWKIDSTTGMSQQAAIEATGIPPTDDLESAILYQFIQPSVNYTAILSGVGNTTGIGLVEIYDLDQAANAQLANISTRGFVGAGNNVMIGGFILGPNTSGASSVVVRGIGPSLTAFGVAGALQNPILELHSGDGTLISSNDNWMDSPNQQTIMDAGLAPTNANESAILAIPSPGNYTAILSGVNNTTGVGLVEVYHLP